jgi:hypothetical protein
MLSFVRLLCITLVLTLAACGRGSDDQVYDFFNDISQGNQAAAAARFSPSLHEKFKDETLHDALAHWSRDMALHGGLKDISVSGGVITFNELALYDVTLLYADGKKKKLKTSLTRTDGVWYINTAL